MFDRHGNSLGLSDRALEMIMRDVLDGLEELAAESSLGSGADGCRVLAIEAPDKNETPRRPADHRGAVVDLFRYRKAV